MTVYAVHPLGKAVDVSTALVYGNLKYINRRYVYSDEIGEGNRAPSQVEEAILTAADDFRPQNDYLLIAGDHLQMLMLAVALSTRHGEFNVLRFDREAAGYISVKIGERLEDLVDID